MIDKQPYRMGPKSVLLVIGVLLPVTLSACLLGQPARPVSGLNQSLSAEPSEVCAGDTVEISHSLWSGQQLDSCAGLNLRFGQHISDCRSYEITGNPGSVRYGGDNLVGSRSVQVDETTVFTMRVWDGATEVGCAGNGGPYLDADSIVVTPTPLPGARCDVTVRVIDPRPTCGDGVCDAAVCETEESCAVDCAPVVCGDGFVSSVEDCEDPSQCSGGLTCGAPGEAVDRACQCVGFEIDVPLEDIENSSDIEIPPGTEFQLPVCGDGTIDEGESCEINSDCPVGQFCGAPGSGADCLCLLETSGPDPEGAASEYFPVYDCAEVDGGVFEWHGAEVVLGPNGEHLQVTYVDGPHQGQWQPFCPAAAPVCGDGTCNGSENANTCPGDCP